VSALPKTMAVRLRPMTESDLTGVMEIERSAYPYPWSQGIFRDCIRVGYSCWVAEHDSSINGYGVMSIGGGEAHILNLCIRPRAQGRGLGRRLIIHLLHIAKMHHAETAFLEVRPSNGIALKLYDSIGFNEVGIRKAYYPAEHGREDALVLAREL
jgi:ribosomal-protein-alanine N-acetyltransferase